MSDSILASWPSTPGRSVNLCALCGKSTPAKIRIMKNEGCQLNTCFSTSVGSHISD